MAGVEDLDVVAGETFGDHVAEAAPTRDVVGDKFFGGDDILVREKIGFVDNWRGHGGGDGVAPRRFVCFARVGCGFAG